MFVFKIVVTTLMLLMIAVIMYASFKAEARAQTTAVIMVLIDFLSIIAIWG